MDIQITHHARQRFKERFGGELRINFNIKDFKILQTFKDNIIICRVLRFPIYCIINRTEGVLLTMITKKQYFQRYVNNQKKINNELLLTNV